ncbi:hypothetical protein B0H14DRAFT_2717349 [Mycena olivaceomarginata]|nr:hypothetical protein B0H14DRAFT_2717349 [Mycena olivaceomarginata]
MAKVCLLIIWVLYPAYPSPIHIVDLWCPVSEYAYDREDTLLRPFKVIPGMSSGLNMRVRRGKCVQVWTCRSWCVDLWVQPPAVDMWTRMCVSWGCTGACRRAGTRVRVCGTFDFCVLYFRRSACGGLRARRSVRGLASRFSRPSVGIWVQVGLHRRPCAWRHANNVLSTAPCVPST